MLLDMTAPASDQENINALIYNYAAIPDRSAFIVGASDASPLPYLLDGIETLENGGCDLIAIPCNTSHFFFDRLTDCAHVPIVNMVAETIDEAQRLGFIRVGLLCTEGTLAGNVYENYNTHQELNLVRPSEECQRLVDQIIYDQVKANQPVDESMVAEVIRSMAACGCDALILGCTELSVAFRQVDALDLPIVDSLAVLASCVIDRCAPPAAVC